MMQVNIIIFRYVVQKVIGGVASDTQLIYSQDCVYLFLSWKLCNALDYSRNQT